MEFDRFGDDEDPPLLFVLGWGNRTHHEPVRWLIDHLSEEFRVHTATLPVHVTDVQAEWVRPVERYAADLDSPALLGHSAGGLTAAHADVDARTRTYLSPWWGYPPATRGPHVDLIARVPLDAKLLPSGINATALGAHATERQVEETPSRVSPRFLQATRAAHESVPEVDEDAVVFCSLSDRVVSLRAIGDNVSSERLVVYDGGHELFSSRSREAHLDTLLSVCREGPDTLD